MKNANTPAYPVQRKIVVQTSQGYADTKIDALAGFTKREVIAKDLLAALLPLDIERPELMKLEGIHALIDLAIAVTDAFLKKLETGNQQPETGN